MKNITDNFEHAQIKIELSRRMTEGKWHAKFAESTVWACGDSMDEAIGNLIRTHWQELNLGLKFTEEIR